MSPLTNGKTAEFPTEAVIPVLRLRYVPTLCDPFTTRVPVISRPDEIAKKNVRTYTPLRGAVNIPLEAL